MIDISGSLENEYDTMIQMARTIVYGLDLDNGNAQVGALAFSSQVQGEFYLNSYQRSRESVITALQFYNYAGTTNQAAALNEVRINQFRAANGARSGSAKVAVLLTDGYSTVEPDAFVPSAQALRNTGVELYVIATGDSPDLSTLQSVASNPSSKYLLQLPTSASITSTANLLLNQICTQ
jgi:hypothetical protein